MSTTEETRFHIRSVEFEKQIAQYPKGTDDAWSVISNRVFEITDSFVKNDQKAKALDRVLWEIDRIFPRAHAFYCETLDKRVAFTNKQDQDYLLRAAKDAYMHKHTEKFSTYGKVIYDIYQKLDSDNKKTFAYKDTAKSYRKKELAEQNAKEREMIIDWLCQADFFINDENTPAEKKLSYIDEVLSTVREKHFGYVKANEIKRDYCLQAVEICTQNGYPADCIDRYLLQVKDYQRRADQANLHTPQGSTEANLQWYMQKYKKDPRF